VRDPSAHGLGLRHLAPSIKFAPAWKRRHVLSPGESSGILQAEWLKGYTKLYITLIWDGKKGVPGRLHCWHIWRRDFHRFVARRRNLKCA